MIDLGLVRAAVSVSLTAGAGEVLSESCLCVWTDAIKKAPAAWQLPGLCI
jgi:hypothetical protein